ncbi:MAG: PKD domain-containing protein [Candidatus Acetothermia bacterium]
MSKFTRNAVSLGLLSVLILGLTFLLTGCGFINQDPEAKISTTPEISSGVAVGTTINFYGENSEDPDGDIETYEWDFKTNKSEDATSTQKNPTYTYETAGTYTVTLTVTDDDGATDSTTATVEVEETELDAEFTMSPDPATEGDEVEFDASDSTGDIDSYEWDFGEGGDSGSGETDTHTYDDPGDYTVQLTIENASGDVSISGQTLEVQTDSNTS